MKKNTDVAAIITQPDFMPWLGSVEKILKADKFVFLDNVTNRPNDGIYTKRVKLMVGDKPQWVTTPLIKTKGLEFERICDMRVDFSQNFQQKQIAQIQNSYRRHPFFKEVFPFVEKHINSGEELISIRNIVFLEDLFELCFDKFHYIKASDYELESSNNQLLIDLVKISGANTYIYGSGSLGYLDFDLWNEHKIRLEQQSYGFKSYPQFSNSGEFTYGLSVVDALMNTGFAGLKNIF